MNADMLAIELGNGTNTLQIVLIVCVFWVLISGREAIRSPALFRVGCLMLAGSLILPVAVFILDGHYQIELPQTYVSLHELVTGPFLVVLCFPFLVMSLAPGKDRKSRSD